MKARFMYAGDAAGDDARFSAAFIVSRQVGGR
jgi:hypothetical protein